jgi:hypothetical protein
MYRDEQHAESSGAFREVCVLPNEEQQWLCCHQHTRHWHAQHEKRQHAGLGPLSESCVLFRTERLRKQRVLPHTQIQSHTQTHTHTHTHTQIQLLQNTSCERTHTQHMYTYQRGGAAYDRVLQAVVKRVCQSRGCQLLCAQPPHLRDSTNSEHLTHAYMHI